LLRNGSKSFTWCSRQFLTAEFSMDLSFYRSCLINWIWGQCYDCCKYHGYVLCLLGKYTIIITLVL
jgi:hypothetical protein